MGGDEIQTSQIRPKAVGFDRRDRTVRGYSDGRFDTGMYALVAIGAGFTTSCYLAGEGLAENDFVELENGLWWKVRP